MPWFVRRIVAALLIAWAVASVVFLAIRFVPGDPAPWFLSMGGAAPSATPVAQLDNQLGLDRSVPAQYVRDFRNVLVGNFGRSLQDGSPVGAAIVLRLPRTLELLVVAAVLAALIGVPIGSFAAPHPHGSLDRACMVFPTSCVPYRFSYSAHCCFCCSHSRRTRCPPQATSL